MTEGTRGVNQVFGCTEVPRCTDRDRGRRPHWGTIRVVWVPRRYSMKTCKMSDGTPSLMSLEPALRRVVSCPVWRFHPLERFSKTYSAGRCVYQPAGSDDCYYYKKIHSCLDGFQSVRVTDQAQLIHYSLKNFQTIRHLLIFTALRMRMYRIGRRWSSLKLSCNWFVITFFVGILILEVACWLLVPKFAGSNPTEAVGFLRAKKSSALLPSEGK